MNHLKDSNSPYLLQHVENPVDWYPWGKTALEKAKKEDKPILVSIGYSSCHWCHVMAHESFEKDDVAALMNRYFVNIKIDREERPDVDQIYMESIQAMGLQGGWPLNVFLTPDQKPFYGGTYFPKDGWKQLITNVADAFSKHRDQLDQSAAKFTQSLQRKISEKYILQGEKQVAKSNIENSYGNLKGRFDHDWGGIRKAPKFPMPCIWNFLLHYSYVTGERSSLSHTLFTLDKMAAGGIYDQLGGGFSRYSVDEQWHIPHFEKMLYDNGQLLSLYALAYKAAPKKEYQQVLVQTLEWLNREMTSPAGGLYSALDADTEGVEGKFYTWTFEEIKKLAGGHADIIADYYDVSDKGNWEGTNVLRRLNSIEKTAEKYELSVEELEKIIESFRTSALEERAKRVTPGLDDKILCSWNSLALKGLLDAYTATQRQEFKDKATTVFDYIRGHLIDGDKLLHQFESNLEGFAEDYATTIQAFITYYEVSSDTHALKLAQKLIERMQKYFYDDEDGFYYFTSRDSEDLIARKKEIFDNVIPASNSIMAENLLRFGLLSYDETKTGQALAMINKLAEMIENEPEYLGQWAVAAMYFLYKAPEIAIVGEDFQKKLENLHGKFIPVKVVAAAPEESTFPELLAHKEIVKDKTTIYVCYDKTCQRPVHEVCKALELI